MNKTIKILFTFAIILLLFIISFSYILNYLKDESDEQNSLPTEGILYVDDENIKGLWHGSIKNPYCKISEAVNNSKEGQTIFIKKGTYHENIIINKPIILMGEEKETTIIDGNYKDYVLKTESNNVEIYNLTKGFHG